MFCNLQHGASERSGEDHKGDDDPAACSDDYLAVRSATLPNAGEGIRFYLLPDFGKVKEAGVFEVVYAAMGQSFFTLSLGIGAIAIFGSYIDKKRALTGEAICVTILDTCVALIAGMIIFRHALRSE